MYGGCTQTLGHFNPLALAHGGPDSSIRHKGDFGNIEIVNNAFSGEIADQEASLYGQYTIIGMQGSGFTTFQPSTLNCN